MSDAIATARHVHDAAAADLDLILGDIARWVAHESPSGATPELDLLAGELAQTLTGYGLIARARPLAGRPARARRARGRRAGRASPCSAITTPSSRSARSRRDRCVARATGCSGPATADMKGGIAVAAHAARLLAGGDRPFARLELVSVPDEEVRSEPIATQARLAGFDAVLCMECGRPGGAVVAARKGGRWLDVVARGRSAHAGSEPEHGRNAVLALARELPAHRRARPRPRGTHAPRHAHARRRRAQLRPRRGARDDRHARLARGRPRLGRGGTAALRPAPRHRLHAGEGRLVTPPLERTPAVAALAVQAAAIGAALGSPVPETSTGGVSDGCWTAGAGLPTLDGLGPVGALDHSPDEYIEIASLAPRCGLVAGLVAAIDGLLAGG